MRSFSDQEVIKRVAGLPTFKGWIDGIYDIWIRSRADAYDRFDDRVFTYLVANGTPRFVMACSGTTNAGSFGLMNFRRYNPAGCAVLKADVIVYESHRQGPHKGKPAYRQARPFPYFRDNDRDRRAEELGGEISEVIYANCHPAGWFSRFIGNWSVACLVRNVREQWNDWFGFMRSRKFPPLNVAILREW